MHRFEIIVTVALNQILFDLSIFERKNKVHNRRVFFICNSKRTPCRCVHGRETEREIPRRSIKPRTAAPPSFRWHPDAELALARVYVLRHSARLQWRRWHATTPRKPTRDPSYTEQLLHPCTLLVKEGGTTIHDLAFFFFFLFFAHLYRFVGREK